MSSLLLALTAFFFFFFECVFMWGKKYFQPSGRHLTTDLILALVTAGQISPCSPALFLR